MNGMKSFLRLWKLIALFLACGTMVCSGQEAEKKPAPALVEVSVMGAVKNPNKYRLKSPISIEQAFARAGGWNGVGEGDAPAKFCRLRQHLDGKEVATKINIHIDPKTRHLSVLDQEWICYRLADGDVLDLPYAIF